MTRHLPVLSFGRRTWWFAAASVLLGAGQTFGASHGEGGETPKPAVPEAKPDEIRGVELGEFRIRSDYPAEAQKSTVRFKLWAAIRGDKLAAMTHMIESHRQKIRDEVITSTRLSTLGVFEETDLKSFRRRVLMRLRRSMPEFVVEDLYVSDFGLSVKSL
jgi:hypothetical protein